jgi:hypothetical protein
MEKPGHETDIAGSRRTHLKKSFKSTLRHLLTACSKQDFVDIFSKFSGAEQELLFQLYTRVVVNLHQTIEEEFDEQCHETQVGPILDTVEELVEEQSLDPLFSDKYVSCILVNPFCLLLSIYGIGLNCKSSPHILEF